MLPTSAFILRSAKVPGKASCTRRLRFDARATRMSPQLSLFRHKSLTFLRQITFLPRLSNERNLPATLLLCFAQSRLAKWSVMLVIPARTVELGLIPVFEPHIAVNSSFPGTSQDRTA